MKVAAASAGAGGVGIALVALAGELGRRWMDAKEATVVAQQTAFDSAKICGGLQEALNHALEVVEKCVR
jgi:hypothetical protein